MRIFQSELLSHLSTKCDFISLTLSWESRSLSAMIVLASFQVLPIRPVCSIYNTLPQTSCLKKKKTVCNLDFSLGTADFISTEGWSFGWKLWIVSISINKEWNPLMSCSNDLMNVVLGQNINKLQANKCCHFLFSQLHSIQNIKTWMSRIKEGKDERNYSEQLQKWINCESVLLSCLSGIFTLC